MLKALCCALMLITLPGLSSCRKAGQTKPATDHFSDSVRTILKTGDLVLRCGRDQISTLFRQLNARDRSYSHCGVAVRTDSGIYVWHITGGVAGTYQGGICAEPLHEFISAERNSAWALLRLPLGDSEARQFSQRILALKVRRIRFDHHFDLTTDQELYCTEMVAKCLKGTAFAPDTSISRNGRPYIGVDDFLLARGAKIVCQITYK
jgi:hypothetical protein